MRFFSIRGLGAACLLMALAACRSPCLPCISGEVRYSPIYVDVEAFGTLTQQINCLNHRMAPLERAMDHRHFPRRLCKRLIQLDDDVQHVRAELLSREVAPEKIQRQIDHIELELDRIETETGTVACPEMCCKSPPREDAVLTSGMGGRNFGRVWRWLKFSPERGSERGSKNHSASETKPSPLPKTPNPVGH